MQAGKVFAGFALRRVAALVAALKRELAAAKPQDQSPILARLRGAEACLANLQQVPVLPREPVVLTLVRQCEEPLKPRQAHQR